MSPTVAANLISLVGELRLRLLGRRGDVLPRRQDGEEGRLGVASDLTDHGRIEGGPRRQDLRRRGHAHPVDEDHRGRRARRATSTTCPRRRGSRPRAPGTRAGSSRTPGTWRSAPGDSGYDEMVKEMKRGMILTSNWYTRFTNYRTGEFSTVPRDGTYLVENGRGDEARSAGSG